GYPRSGWRGEGVPRPHPLGAGYPLRGWWGESVPGGDEGRGRALRSVAALERLDVRQADDPLALLPGAEAVLEAERAAAAPQLEQDLSDRLDLGAERDVGVEDEPEAELAQLVQRQDGRSATLDHVRHERHVERLADLAQLLARGGCLDEEDVGAGLTVAV